MSWGSMLSGSTLRPHSSRREHRNNRNVGPHPTYYDEDRRKGVGERSMASVLPARPRPPVPPPPAKATLPHPPWCARLRTSPASTFYTACEETRNHQCSTHEARPTHGREREGVGCATPQPTLSALCGQQRRFLLRRQRGVGGWNEFGARSAKYQVGGARFV